MLKLRRGQRTYDGSTFGLQGGNYSYGQPRRRAGIRGEFVECRNRAGLLHGS